MRKHRGVAYLIPIMIACVGACAHRQDTNRNLPPRANEAQKVQDNLDPYDTPNPGTASGPVTTGEAGEAENASDRKITEDVRRAIMADDTLSMDAKSIEVTTDEGVVTLDGPVATDEEKKVVADKAMQVAGVTRVHNKTDVKHVR